MVQCHVIAKDMNVDHGNGALEYFKRVGPSEFKGSMDPLEVEA